VNKHARVHVLIFYLSALLTTELLSSPRWWLPRKVEESKLALTLCQVVAFGGLLWVLVFSEVEERKQRKIQKKSADSGRRNAVTATPPELMTQSQPRYTTNPIEIEVDELPVALTIEAAPEDYMTEPEPGELEPEPAAHLSTKTVAAFLSHKTPWRDSRLTLV
jgi:hypothetical protein